MDVGKELKINNPLGKMKVVKIEETLDLTKIGRFYENLGSFEKLRIEFYKEGWFSLRDGNKNVLYLFNLGFNNSNSGYKCKIIDLEREEYDLERIYN